MSERNIIDQYSFDCASFGLGNYVISQAGMILVRNEVLTYLTTNTSINNCTTVKI